MKTKLYPKRSASAAFTLIELLTVIAIIGILAAIIIPTIGKVRATARQTQAISNLREITKASLIFATDNKGYGPCAKLAIAAGRPGYESLNLLLPYLSGSDANKAIVFLDPTTDLTGPENTPALQFSANRWLHDDAGYDEAKLPTFAVNLLRTPSLIIYFADGILTSQNNANQAANQLFNDTGQNGVADAFISTRDDLVVSSYQQAGSIAYRAQGNTAAKVSYADGHVSVIKKGTIRNLNMNPNL
jgi:prepilin-type N-terminal cleavage/methylation domain-containing protein